MRVQTHAGEHDSIIEQRQDVERLAPAGCWGHVKQRNHADREGVQHWDVTFEGGVWIVLSDAELRSEAYTLADPASVEQCALALAYGYDEAALTMYDEDMISVAEVLTSAHGEILAMVAELTSLREQLAAKATK